MALIKKDADAFNVDVDKRVNTDRLANQNTTPSPAKKVNEYSASQRKSLRVDPPVYETLKTIAYIKDIKMYELVNEAIEDYKTNQMSAREREIFDTMQRTKDAK
ncbi:hypothetical protein [Furfurilactobacillus rossiae]|uniref:Uncharacterized protein n=1 Tax=Furfurilactobacillus rossiae DSM 15814 TaxID=1114972 RepID=A0A0R1RFD3_9LACO|nr:hypothetical protein [Furfurilactobacillus rossiae]KRL53988.1 hypothetical protein FD35_GL000690 [Furfurilactobacillus rossiae DSM 15814]QFR68242.1 hypothetical protein LR814_13855 [Furfurilactobacillus rossiae]QLE62699.1 hypothetical protein LROSRS0_p10063 [Furfurilactobacillus rossiae]